jgi:hypothetical protein
MKDFGFNLKNVLFLCLISYSSLQKRFGFLILNHFSAIPMSLRTRSTTGGWE